MVQFAIVLQLILDLHPSNSSLDSAPSMPRWNNLLRSQSQWRIRRPISMSAPWIPERNESTFLSFADGTSFILDEMTVKISDFGHGWYICSVTNQWLVL